LELLLFSAATLQQGGQQPITVLCQLNNSPSQLLFNWNQPITVILQLDSANHSYSSTGLQPITVALELHTSNHSYSSIIGKQSTKKELHE